MNPNAINRVAVVAVVSAVVLSVAVASGRRCHQTIPATQVVAEVAVPAESVDVARAEADAARAEVEAEQAAVESERAQMQDEAALEAAKDNESQDSEEELAKIRQAAKDYVKGHHPDSKADGVFLLPLYRESLYIAGVDTQFSNNVRGTVDLLVRRYVRKGTNSYWRAESLDGGQAALIKNLKQK